MVIWEANNSPINLWTNESKDEGYLRARKKLSFYYATILLTKYCSLKECLPIDYFIDTQPRIQNICTIHNQKVKMILPHRCLNNAAGLIWPLSNYALFHYTRIT